MKRNKRNKRNMMVVFNTCGIKGRENSDYYISAIDGILASNLAGLKVVFSDCLSSKAVRDKIYNHFGNKIVYNFIDEILPVNVTFNHSVLETVKRYGEYNCYVFWDSGCRLQRPDDLCYIYEGFLATEAGMLSPISNIDAHYAYGLKLGNHFDDYIALSIMFKDGRRDYIVPDGRACGAHVNLISNDLFKFYGRVCPDVFAGFCTESTFSFLCGAIKKNWIITNRATVIHNHAMDGTSSGFLPDNHGRPYDYGFRVSNLLARFESEEARRLGMGYEECAGIVMHDKSQWDKNYHCKNDELKHWIRKNCFLPSRRLNYNKINHTYIPYYTY